jgi:peptidoglycan/LPS O-acetylase OafA/YrhL
MAKFYIRSLDGLRGVAVLLVFLFHFGRLGITMFNFEIGWVGVQLFFVLSGYLITRILLEEKNAALKYYLTRFYWRRVLRIFPLYFGYLFLLFLAFTSFSTPENFPIVAKYLFSYTYNYSPLIEGLHISRFFTHLWSLSVEEQFYIFWPVLIYFLLTRQIKIIIAVLLIGTPLFRFCLYEALSQRLTDPETLGTSIYWFTVSHLDAFAIGAGINLVPKASTSAISARWIIITGFICLAAGALNYYSLSHASPLSLSNMGYPIHEVRNFQVVWCYSLLDLFFASILWHLISSGNLLLSTKIPVFLGRISYGIYVLHFPIMGIIIKTLGKIIVNEWLTFTIHLGATLIAASLSYFLYEQRFLKIKSSN